MRTLSEYLRTNKTLQYLSLNNCSISKDLMNAIGRGLNGNEKLENLLLKGNNLEEEGLEELLEALENNSSLRLK